MRGLSPCNLTILLARAEGRGLRLQGLVGMITSIEVAATILG